MTAHAITEAILRCDVVKHYEGGETPDTLEWMLSDVELIAPARNAGDLSMAMIDACLTDETGNGVCQCYFALAELLGIAP
jgi:hypothetical protein